MQVPYKISRNYGLLSIIPVILAIFTIHNDALYWSFMFLGTILLMLDTIEKKKERKLSVIRWIWVSSLLVICGIGFVICFILPLFGIAIHY